MFFCKEAVRGEIGAGCLFGNEIAGFPLRADDGAVLKHRARRKIGVICSMAEEDANSVLLSSSMA